MNSYAAVCRLRDVMRRQHMAFRTESMYVYWLKRYCNAVQRMPPDLTSEKKVERFLTDLATINNVAASTQNQAFNALLYFYNHILEQPLQSVDALRASRPDRLRHAPTVAEIRALLPVVPDLAGYPTNLIARLIYGAGLRVTEPLNLRIKDLNLEKSALFIMGAKGGDDRVVPLPASLRTEITQQIYLARATWQRDKQNHIPLLLPHQLARKYPEYQFSWSWAWLFPSKSTCHDRLTNQTVRFRMQESFVQRAIKQARNKLGIPVLPHELRHAYATHCMESGVSPRAIQQVMGHKSIETTMRYLHAESLSVPSPLDRLGSANPDPDPLSLFNIPGPKSGASCRPRRSVPQTAFSPSTRIVPNHSTAG